MRFVGEKANFSAWKLFFSAEKFTISGGLWIEAGKKHYEGWPTTCALSKLSSK
jgi:hypothetical protein